MDEEVYRERVCCGLPPQNCMSRRPEMDFYMLDPGGLALQRCYFSDLNVVYPQVHDSLVLRYIVLYNYIFINIIFILYFCTAVF